jgi:hypothetical protein
MWRGRSAATPLLDAGTLVRACGRRGRHAGCEVIYTPGPGMRWICVSGSWPGERTVAFCRGVRAESGILAANGFQLRDLPADDGRARVRGRRVLAADPRRWCT